jgi:Pyruvate/2-oxoacid:ferredoxin oxidoreductase delta subunit
MSKYKKLIIFYFSGTGNAKSVSEWISTYALNLGISSKIIDVSAFNRNEFPEIDSNTLVGFSSPTHGFNLPPLMMKFILQFPKSVRADVFLINTRAGLKLHKIFLPGLSGMAQFFYAIILMFKNYRIVGMQPMDMPSNWISFHPGLREKVVISIIKRCKGITDKFSETIFSGRKKFKALISLPFDIAVIPIAILYYFAGRFGLAKTFVSTEKCNLCGLCIKQCPVKAIIWAQKRPYWTFNCESCMHCINSCPQRAIETATGFTFLVWWAVFSIVPLLLVWIFGLEFLDKLFHPLSWLVYNLLYIGFALLFVYLSYHVLHFLMRFSFFNKLVAYTSLTRFKWWRRYKMPGNTLL